MRLSLDENFDEHYLMDIHIASANGMIEDDVETIMEFEGAEVAEGTYSWDFLCNVAGNQKVMHVSSDTEKTNFVTITEGRKLQSDQECLLDFAFAKNNNLIIGDTIRLISSDTNINTTYILKYDSYKIVGFYATPEYISIDRGNTTIGQGEIDAVVRILPECFLLPYYTGVNVCAQGARELTTYTQDYDDTVTSLKEKMEEEWPDWYITDRNSLPSFDQGGENADRIKAIATIFPVIFFLVAALICLTTMTRMVEEQRGLIGTMKALGYGKAAIAGKYIWYAFFATIGGSIVGMLIGEKIIPAIIIIAYQIIYPGIPNVVVPYHIGYAVASTGVALVCTIGATMIACYKEFASVPAALMRPVAPKSGKRIWIEKIGFIWNRLKFLQKSSLRNLFRYKKRFFMTILGIGGCMGLLLVGYGIKDSIFIISEKQYEELQNYDAMVIYNTAHDSIEENVDTFFAENKEVKDYTNVYMLATTAFTEAGGLDTNVIIPRNVDDFAGYVTMRDRETEAGIVFPEKGVAITEKLARVMNVSVGDSFYITMNGKDYKFEVAEIIENYIYHYAYMTPEYYNEIIGETLAYNTFFYQSVDNKQETYRKIGEDVLKLEGVFNVTYIASLKEQVEDMLGSLDIVIVVLIISAGLLAFVVLYNLNNINITERIRELATIKVLGFYDMELTQYIYRENVLLTIMGIAFGCIFGKVLHRFVITSVEIETCMFGRNLDFSSFIYSIIWTILFSVLVNCVMYFKLKKIDMIESLKSVE